MLHEAIERTLVARERCGALVRKSLLTTDAAKEGYDWLSRICPVIDIDADDAMDELLNLLPEQTPTTLIDEVIESGTPVSPPNRLRRLHRQDVSSDE
jgi:hypothetical protein